jgi:arylsulfatase A-like enzyme
MLQVSRALKAIATKPSKPANAGFLSVLAGVSCFLAVQYGIALWRLAQTSGGMMNKFSALAREEHLGFLVGQNLLMLVAYGLLAIAATLLVRPFASLWTSRSRHKGLMAVVIRSAALAAAVHGFFMLRLVETRPYFLSDADFGHWYYQILNAIPESMKGASHLVLFQILPLALVLFSICWHAGRHGKKGWVAFAIMAAAITGSFGLGRIAHPPAAIEMTENRPYNVIILGSDSLRGDKLGASGYRPARADGSAAAGVSPAIDALAARSARFELCYAPIASTLESGVSLMSSQYPQTHGIRQMYPDRETVEAAKARITSIAQLLRDRGYDTAAIGDWCAGYYEPMPMGFEHISVSSFDNFKIYMSQAVVMAHFVIPLYFDHELGYRIFPQLGSFAQFVTPEVVTRRVEERLAAAAADNKPFFWHVFYSCNHLPYRSPEPYNSMFADPAYQGPNRHGVDFDIDAFIGGTDLESKWKALPPVEIEQIRALYDGATRQFDDQVSRVLAAIENHGLADRTIILITSDHGDDLYEPGVTLGHGLTFNGGLQANHVPLILHVPGTAPKVIPQSVRLIDIAPTLADLLDVGKPDNWQGESFAPWLDGGGTPEWRPFYGETGFPFIQFRVPGVERPKLPPMDQLTFIDRDFNYQFVVREDYRERIVEAKQRCLRTRHWKLVCTPTAAGDRHFSLFQLTADPHGETDLATSRPDVLLPMKAALERWMDAQVESPIGAIFPGGEPE